MTTSDRPIEAALAADYPALRQALLAYLRRHVGDAQVAEDLLQDVMVKALASPTASVPDNVAAWLMTVARNTMIDHLRARRPTEPLPDELIAPDTGTADEALLACLRPMAERLPQPYREAVLAAEFDGVGLAVLAEKDRVSLSAIKSRTSRGRVMLREELVRCCRVAVAPDGAGLDYDERKVSGCAPAPSSPESKTPRGTG